ncbi:PREDICTED: vegetative cell wall protein gp1-like isoform X2 [Ipomoea nil]|uniref:vegetative cell wall protein gp1-like isoform X2 n=1 Tax=Ipomoea nil TaxID=35883 RepID=UPI0009018C33|nr:PREDICTED: vegetative cell wall protein gp1-like isoform X2 [Ipomoea nil]
MASQQQQARPMFRFASMLRPAGAPPPPPPAAAAAPQPMFRPPMAAPFRPPPPQTRDPSPPQRPATAPAPAPAPPPPTAPAPPQPVAPPPAAPPAPRSPARTVQPRFTVGAPPPAPEPRPAAAIPSAPKSPAVQDSTRPFQLYQAPKPATSSSSRSPPPSPRNLEPAMKETNQYSPKVKPAVSPLKLPPAAQFKSEAEVEPRIPAEIDQKTVVVQQRSERNKATAQKFNATQRYGSSETDWTGKREAMMTKDKDNVHHKKRSDTEESLGISILTLAGENKGAMMELSPAQANKHGFNGNPRRLQKEWSEGEKSGKESDEEEGKSRMGEKNNNPKGTESLPMTAFTNSNVQGVNNSVLHNATCTHHDPGVHLTFSRKAGRYTKEAQRLKD